MPHKCVRCGKMYGSGAEELLKGCSCSSRIFLFVRPEQVTLKEQMEILKREGEELVSENKAQLEEIAEITPITIEKASPVEIDLGEMSKPIGLPPTETKGVEKERAEIVREAAEILEGKSASLQTPTEKPVENITILGKGQYELDINSLMQGNPLVIKSEHGVFYIRIPAPVKKQEMKRAKK